MDFVSYIVVLMAISYRKYDYIGVFYRKSDIPVFLTKQTDLNLNFLETPVVLFNSFQKPSHMLKMNNS